MDTKSVIGKRIIVQAGIKIMIKDLNRFSHKSGFLGSVKSITKKIINPYKFISIQSKHKKLNKELKNKFYQDFKLFKQLELDTKSRFIMDWDDRFPCHYDNTSKTTFDRHYILHPAWAARILKETNPKEHFDISSTLHFCSIISAFIKVNFFDFRPAELRLSNLICEQADLTKLHFHDNSINSLSCMHTIEHIGLGRYGDQLNYDGDIIAIRELVRVLALDGNLLVVVPIASVPKIYYNAHRVYSVDQILKCFKDLKLQEFCLIPDSEEDGDLIVDPSQELMARQKYGCGCFWFTKLPDK